MPRIVFLIALLELFTFSFSQAQFTAGQTYFGTNNYIEYHAGDLPIIVSAPHGGYLEPATIPDRSCSGCVTVRDSRTEELAYQIDSAVQVLFGGHPHIIINKLARTKLDANREIVEAAQGNPQAETAWAEYHTFIQASKDGARNNFGSALYIDLHGHGHSIQRLELGYLISRTQLQNNDSTLDALNFQNSSSIKHLSNVLNPGVSFAEILRGNECMGEFLVEQGYPGTPSASDPAPGPTDPYFSGGYNTVRHGSRDSSDINGIQFELNWTGVRDNATNRSAFARGLACAMRDYLDRWFFDLDAWNPGHLVTTTSDSGPGSLRDALLGAEDGDIVTFDPNLNGDTIRLEKELRICSQVTIQGPGDSLLAISGGDSTRLIRALPSDSVNILDLSLVRGKSPTGEDGAGILVEGTVRLTNCTIANNYADDDGGGVSIKENALAILEGCTIQNNSCGDDGAGLRNFNGTLEINNSTVSNNTSPSFGGGLSSNGVVTISKSTFSANSADGAGGGIRTFGGTLSLENSTIASNMSNNRGGGISTSIDFEMNFCTVVNNTAVNQGGGIRLTNSNCTIENTLVANNAAPLEPDLGSNGGTYLSNGYNFIGDSTGSAWVPALADQLGNTAAPLDPLLLPISNNGGPTQTAALDLGSPCINSANSTSAPATDQRGWIRIYGGQPDIGAFEYQPPVHISQNGSTPWDETNHSHIKLFPNPAQDRLVVEFPDKGTYQISIGNMLGQIFLDTVLTDSSRDEFDVSKWPEGVYWIKVGGGMTAEKVFLVH